MKNIERLGRGYDELTGKPPRQYFVADAPAILSRNIDVTRVAGGLVNGKLCKMKTLSWYPEDESHDVVRKLKRGTLRPNPDGKPYLVPRPYTVNVEVTNRDGSATLGHTLRCII